MKYIRSAMFGLGLALLGGCASQETRIAKATFGSPDLFQGAGADGVEQAAKVFSLPDSFLNY